MVVRVGKISISKKMANIEEISHRMKKLVSPIPIGHSTSDLLAVRCGLFINDIPLVSTESTSYMTKYM
jgi:hypothetical protein